MAPTTPGHLRSPGATDRTVSLAWDASTDNVAVTGYDIYRNAAKVGSTTSTTFTDMGLAAETAYLYTIKARGVASNESLASAALTVTTKPAATGGNNVTVYYKQGYGTPYMHYRPEGGT